VLLNNDEDSSLFTVTLSNCWDSLTRS